MLVELRVAEQRLRAVWDGGTSHRRALHDLEDLRARHRTATDTRTDRRNKRSPSAPSTGPSTPNATTTTAA